MLRFGSNVIDNRIRGNGFDSRRVGKLRGENRVTTIRSKIVRDFHKRVTHSLNFLDFLAIDLIFFLEV